MNFANLKIAGRWVERHLPEILTGVAIAGVPLTVYETVKATLKTKETIETMAEADTLDKVKVTYKYWIPPVAAAVGTTACIVGANHLHIKKETALAAVGTLWKGKYTDLESAIKSELSDKDQDKVITKFKETDMASATDQKLEDPNDGKEWVYEPNTKQFIRLSPEEIIWAGYTLNMLITERHNITLNDFLRIVPGAKTHWSGDELGWFTKKYTYGHPWVHIQASKGANVNGRDVKWLEFSIPPKSSVDS